MIRKVAPLAAVFFALSLSADSPNSFLISATKSQKRPRLRLESWDASLSSSPQRTAQTHCKARECSRGARMVSVR